MAIISTVLLKLWDLSR